MRFLRFLLCTLAMLVLVASPVVAALTTRVSLTDEGTQANGGSSNPAISPDGRYIAFTSSATNLVADDTNSVQDIFVRDRQTGETQRVSVASDGTQADGDCYAPTITANGRYVVFGSVAFGLVAGDNNGTDDVFVHDRQTGLTECVSVTGDGTSGNSYSYIDPLPCISADGRYVAFSSEATDLIAGDTNGKADVFVRDRQTGLTERVSLTHDDTEAHGDSNTAAISADGRYVCFRSNASDLVANDTNGWTDIFVRDRQAGETQRVSVASDGTQANDNCAYSSMTADGRYVVFRSRADTLVAGDINGQRDFFVHDRQTGETELVSVAPEGVELDWEGCWPRITADGRCVVFMSFATNLVPGDTNGQRDVFLRDRAAATTRRVSVATDGTQGDGVSCKPAMSPNGGYIAFISTAPNLVPGDTNVTSDIFVHERLSADFSGAPAAGPGPLTVTFTDLSPGDPTSWSWDFGDGGASAEQSPSHAYETAGHQTVSLTVTGADGSDTETKVDYITVAFQDVALESWACDEILCCVDAGIVSGYSPSRYEPTWPVSRDQMAVFIARALVGATVPAGPEEATFDDVPTDHWGYKYVEYCVITGVVQGFDPVTYGPTVTVSRDAMAVFIARAVAGDDDSVPAGPDTASFDDVPTDHWAYQYIEYCAAGDVVGGYPYPDPDNPGETIYLYQPGWTVCRDQMAVFITRAFDLPM